MAGEQGKPGKATEIHGRVWQDAELLVEPESGQAMSNITRARPSGVVTSLNNRTQAMRPDNTANRL